MKFQVHGNLTPEYRAYLNSLDPEKMRALLTATFSHPEPKEPQK